MECASGVFSFRVFWFSGAIAIFQKEIQHHEKLIEEKFNAACKRRF
jgi:hypothetical protein